MTNKVDKLVVAEEEAMSKLKFRDSNKRGADQSFEDVTSRS
jgi:hypothetical protein